ncbi:hypothetical protein COLO4_31665 [Corchorus olitorius]|uniref:BHLH domain-containing protein n=1 Tax=Corchorus olitorius TaxID=93759 RepID=A0A1R3H3K8_9ROSI|nr:hypothetical protein COLO4_31665 [Corchorus olitorius]
MAEEFQAGICGAAGTWWNPSKNMFAGCSSPCSTGIVADMGSFGWATAAVDMVDIKARSSCEESNNSVSDNSSIVFQGIGHHQNKQADSDHSAGSSILIDSTLQMMGFGLSSNSTTTSDWNQSLLCSRSNGRSDQSYNSILEEDHINSTRLSNCRQETVMDSSHHQIQKDWSPKSYSPAEDSSITNFKPIIDQNFSLNCSGNNNYGYPSSATLLQTLFEPDPPHFNNRSINYMSPAAATNYGANVVINELSSAPPPASWQKLAPFLRPAAASVHKQPPLSSGLHFSNNTPFWNASAGATAINDVKSSFLPSQQSQFLAQTFEEKPNCPTLTTKTKNEEVRDSGSVMKKGSCEPPFKRPRIETPSPLPTFKVRKEKLGDRITALQQLVSPFGKTDTASVLHEAIEYIKFLHDQVNTDHKLKEAEKGPKQDLRSRGLCLVPISSTFPVANETTADFWTPTFGGTFR